MVSVVDGDQFNTGDLEQGAYGNDRLYEGAIQFLADHFGR